MNLLVLLALILHVASHDFFVGVLAHRVHVETTRPEMPAPEDFFDLRMLLENVFGCETFGNLGNF